MKLSTSSYKGSRDFYPEDQRLIKYIFRIWREVAESFGYEEYNGPMLEYLDIYQAKSGDEIVNEQTYRFADRSGRQVVIRPEMTPTVSRLVAARRQQLTYPLRLYSIPNLWRYERPQSGRLREHWQLNVDLFGVSNISAEYELISLIADIFKSFGASPEMYEVRLNSRSLAEHIFKNYLKISDHNIDRFRRLVDKSAKLKPADFAEAARDILGPEQYSGLRSKLDSLFSLKTVDDLPEEVRSHSAAQEIAELTQSLLSSGQTNIRFDPAIMRGLDYYTDIVFEVFDTHEDNNRSMVAGGRYDGLVGLFGVDELPTAGFGWGDVTMARFLELHHLVPALKTETDLLLALIDLKADRAHKVVSQLRQAGLNVAVDYSGRRLGDQLKAAEKKGLGSVLIVGEDELISGRLTYKDLSSGEAKKLTTDELINLLSKTNDSD